LVAVSKKNLYCPGHIQRGSSKSPRLSGTKKQGFNDFFIGPVFLGASAAVRHLLSPFRPLAYYFAFR
jgi:hypothetical protein